MPHPPETKVSTGQPNIQDVVPELRAARRLVVAIQLARRVTRSKGASRTDRFAVIVEVAGADHMLFKHAIASIRTPRAVANYFTHG
jgi:sRNA-binding regulator protein Hfq